ncbi:MAG: ABC transporter [Bacteroidetes bacterium GWF2_42_66]|nr:MAG: ABC transporter [Bacteroidetes bacterium GWA2_42_15]OFY01022.1 MAG: ABC transporter [Bacteroidetes bacterium GWE2_42_39]OFY41863.1 MAG: ABC transporter [Bacteroidetes bacterium GWF2_42_66]HBL77961.1 ABC transporter [Prolixibacteraceae bacterium]HCR90182.1 ABC transporter [Prolixibacteraceae bacterium]
MNNKTVIEISQLRKRYGKKEVLQGIDLTISPGKIIGYIGPNGAGKSTTVKILCGLITDFQGEITMLGKNLRTDSLEIKKQIGYIPENASLYESLTPIEFMGFLGEMRGMEAERTREKAEALLDIFEMKPNANQRIATFSKGMRQKVLICSGLIHNPDIVFMDEPLSGLDANSVIMVKEMLTQIARDGKTIFYSSHLMDVVEKISHRIILIDNGKVIADGSFDELKQLSNDENLEKMFTRLTGNTGHGEKAGAFINAFEK